MSSKVRNAANGINDAGIVVGSASRQGPTLAKFDIRATRWDARGAVTELGHLETDVDGLANASAIAVNQLGIAIGSASKFDQFGASVGILAVRWDANTTVAAELEPAAGFARSLALKINRSGVIVGYSDILDANGNSATQRAVCWESGSATPLLGELSGATHTAASAISAAGLIVGGPGVMT